MKQKLPTNTTIEVKVNVDKPITATVEYKDNALRLLDENGNCIPFDCAKVEKSRFRASSNIKGNKTLSKVVCEMPSHSINKVVFDNYDVVYAIDTNTKEINGLWYSVGALVKLTSFEKTHNKSYKYQIELDKYITSENDFKKSRMEQWVWLKAIEIINVNELSNKKIGLVVDCDLGNIDKYNNREIKICGKSLVPLNITLLYASADNKNSDILTIMIAAADKLAKQLLKQKLIS